MKKIYLSMAIAAVVMVSCSSPADKNRHACCDVKSEIEQCNDPGRLKMLVDRAVAHADSLQAIGKGAEAREYLKGIESAVSNKDASVAVYFDRVRMRLDAEAAVDTIKTVADKTKDKIKDKASEVKETVKDAANDAIDKAKDVAAGVADKTKSALDR